MSINHALAVRSDFSIGESTLQVSDLVDQAKSFGYETVALVDNMTISSMVSFMDKAKKAGIRPIIGCTLKVFDDPTYRKPKKDSGEVERPNRSFWMKVYVRNEAGMQEVLRLLSRANTEEYFYYHARIGLKDIFELLGKDNVVFSTGDFYNLYHHPEYSSIIDQFHAQDYTLFSEVVPVDTPLFDRLNNAAIRCASNYSMPLIATYPALYAEGAADTLDVLRAIATNGKMSSRWVQRPFIRNFSIKSPLTLATELKRLYPAVLKQCLVGMGQMVKLCSYEFKKMAPCLPVMAPDEFAAMQAHCVAGWKQRFTKPVLGHQPTVAELQRDYVPRLKYELGVLKAMGFSNYFLLVEEIVKWSKSQNIIVGPGRGSVGGSLVAYLLGITDVDPIRFDLLFERFINPERLDLPDADLDFMSRRRGEVIAHITETYGADRVAGVSNYNAMGAAGVIRDVSRVHGLEIFEYACSKQIEKEHGVSLGLKESVESVPDIDKFRNKHPGIWAHALGLEGAMRGYGQHAAGIVVAGEPLINRAVVETRSGGPVVNWDKKYVEDWGLIKMDILGLSTLDMLDLGRQYVEQRHHIKVDYLRLPIDDPKVMGAFGRGETTGIFQFESSGMRRLLKELALAGTLTFDDLVAVTALYRPGPLDAGLCDDYVAIKQGAKSATLEHPNMANALKPTFGVIVYQEQVMQIARDVAGFTMAGADHLRKAMGKKDKDAMAAQRQKWTDGCMSHSGMTEAAAHMLFDKIELFAGYAFNKSHSVEYSIISYWSMWLKTNYPAEFYAASMTVIDKEEKLQPLVADALRVGITTLPPDINLSSDKIEIVGERELYTPFQAIKGISEKVTAHILAARKELGGTVKNRTDFYAALLTLGIQGKVNVRHRAAMEALGTFAKAEGDPITSVHLDRLKDRLALLPGFTVEVVKATRGINDDKLARIKLVRLAEETRSCEGCSLKGNAHPLPRIGNKPKFMVVFDNPTYDEEKMGHLLAGDGAAYFQAALRDAGLSPQDGYFTSLVKSGKPRGVKALTNEQINGCSKFLVQEIELLKPPVIVTMGANATKYFAPAVKGGSIELAGKVVFDPKLDASLVFGINPVQVVFDPSKISTLQNICEKIADLINN